MSSTAGEIPIATLLFRMKADTREFNQTVKSITATIKTLVASLNVLQSESKKPTTKISKITEPVKNVGLTIKKISGEVKKTNNETSKSVMSLTDDIINFGSKVKKTNMADVFLKAFAGKVDLGQISDDLSDVSNKMMRYTEASDELKKINVSEELVKHAKKMKRIVIPPMMDEKEFARLARNLRWMGRDIMRLGYLTASFGAIFGTTLYMSTRSSMFLAGSLDDVRFILEDITSVIGDKIAPIIDAFIPILEKFADLMWEHDWFANFITGAVVLGFIITTLISGILMLTGVLALTRWGMLTVADEIEDVTNKGLSLSVMLKQTVAGFRMLFQSILNLESLNPKRVFDNLKNQARSLRDTVQQTIQSKGWKKATIDFVNPLNLGRKALKGIRKGFGKLKASVQKSNVSMKGFVASMVAGAMLGFVMQPVMEALSPLFEVFADAIADALEPFQPFIDALADWLDINKEMIGIILLVIGAILLLIATGGSATPMIVYLAGGVLGLTGALVFLKNAWDDVSNALSGAYEWFKSVTQVERDFEVHTSSLTQATQVAYKWIWNLSDAIFNIVKPLFDYLGITDEVRIVWDKTTEVFVRAYTILLDLYDAIAHGDFSALIQALTDTSALVDAIIDLVTTLGDTMINVFAEATKSVLDFILNALGLSEFTDEINTVVDTMKDVFIDFFNSLPELIGDAITYFLDWIKDSVIGYFTGGTGGTEYTGYTGSPQGTYQFGGYVPKTGIYKLHAGEYVVPTNGGVTVNINMTNTISSDIDIDSMVDRMVEEIKRQLNTRIYV